MNIYALRGHKVRCIATEDEASAIIFTCLEVGKEYTIENTEVGNWCTDVYLQEFPNVKFNSILFEDVTEQTKELNKQHPDWEYFNN